MVAVMIGVDPHKGSHTAVVISPAEEPLGELRVRASAAQAEKLIGWAAAWPERTWAVEGAGGLGRLLAQQLVAAGEQVLDVQPKLASRVRGGEPDRRPAAADRRQRARGRRNGLAVPDHRAQRLRRRDARPDAGPRAGLGLVFVPTSLVILNKVTPGDAGAASSLNNVGQQVGGSIGLAVVGTVAWSAVASSLRSAAAASAKAGIHVSGAKAAAPGTQIYHHALATGFSRGYLVSAGILALILIIALFMMRVSREDLSGADPAPEPTGDTSSPRPA